MLIRIVLTKDSAMLRVARSASRHGRLVKTARALHRGETTEVVGEQEGARLEVALDPAGNLLALQGGVLFGVQL